MTLGRWAAITKYHRLINNTNFFLMGIESGKSKIRAQLGDISGVGPLPGDLSLCRPRVRELCGISFIEH